MLAVEKRKLNLISTWPGTTLVAPVPPWMLEICQVVGGKIFVALIPFGVAQFGDGRRRQVDRVATEVRVGDVALDALDRQLAGQRAAAAVLDHVAERIDRGRLADDAEVERFAARLQGFDDGDGAVGGIAFLVRGEQEGDASRDVAGGRR